MDIRHRFSRKVRYLRQARRWTQERLAERAGVTPKYIGQIERGEVSPTLLVLAKLARAFEMPLHEMLFLEGDGHFTTEAVHRELSTSELDQVRSGLSVLGKLFGTARVAAPERHRGEPGVILLVEHDDRDAEVAVAEFGEQRLANRVVRVRDGGEALDYLYRRGAHQRRAGGDPVVVLLELKTPRVGGLDVLRKLKSDPALAMIPVVLLVASRAESDLAEARRLGADAHIVKPLGFEKLARVAREIGLFWTVRNEAPDPPADPVADAGVMGS